MPALRPVELPPAVRARLDAAMAKAVEACRPQMEEVWRRASEAGAERRRRLDSITDLALRRSAAAK